MPKYFIVLYKQSSKVFLVAGLSLTSDAARLFEIKELHLTKDINKNISRFKNALYSAGYGKESSNSYEIAVIGNDIPEFISLSLSINKTFLGVKVTYLKLDKAIVRLNTYLKYIKTRQPVVSDFNLFFRKLLVSPNVNWINDCLEIKVENVSNGRKSGYIKTYVALYYLYIKSKLQLY